MSAIKKSNIEFKRFLKAEIEAIKQSISKKLIVNCEDWVTKNAKEFKLKWSKSKCRNCNHRKCRYHVKRTCKNFIQISHRIQGRYDRQKAKSHQQKRNTC